MSILLLCLITSAVYLNGMGGEFIFDDKPLIVDNQNIRSFKNIFSGNSGQEARPAVYASLAFNYAIGGLNPRGYHIFNLVVHILTMLTLFGIVRKTLLLPKLKARFEKISCLLAFCVALIWSIHPLQTECVAYVFQRSESMQAFFYLSALYGFIHSAMQRGWRRIAWVVTVIASSLLGMSSKATFISLPAMLLLYDRVFLSQSYIEAIRRRWGIMLCVLFAVLIVSVGSSELHLMAAGYVEPTPPDIEEFGVGHATYPMEYYRSQPTIILSYLKLAFWPDALCLDYNLNPIDDMTQILVTSAALLFLLTLTVVLFLRIPPLGFCLAFVFIVLAPTALYWKLELMFTYRMYLPLAGLVCFSIFAGYLLLYRFVRLTHLSLKAAMGIGAAFFVLAIVALSARTIVRNRDFADQLSVYRSVVETRPENFRGHYNLANRLLKRYRTFRREGRNTDAQAAFEEAVVHYQEAIRLFPKYLNAHVNLAVAYGIDGRTSDLIEQLENAVKLDPTHTTAQYNLAQGYRRRGRESKQSGRHAAARKDFEAAIVHYERASALQPDHRGALLGLGVTMFFLARYDEAASSLRAYLRIDPRRPEALKLLGESLFELKRFKEAEKVVLQYVHVNPESRWGTMLLNKMADAASGDLPNF